MGDLNILANTKPQDLKKSDFNSQICMRCAKAPAIEGDIFCARCIKERAEIDEDIRSARKDYEGEYKNDEEKKEELRKLLSNRK